MRARKYAPKETGHVTTLSKYDRIAVEKRYGCIKNGRIVPKRRTIRKVKCKPRKTLTTGLRKKKKTRGIKRGKTKPKKMNSIRPMALILKIG